MSIRPLIVLTLLAALLCVTFPSYAQPSLDETWLTVKFLTADGKPATTVPDISIANTDGKLGMDKIIISAQDNSYLLTALTVGDYQLTAFVQGVSMGTRAITLSPGSNTMEWRLPALATLTIKATTAEGNDVKTPLTFTFTNAAGNTVVNVRAISSVANVSTFADIYPGDYQVAVAQVGIGVLDVRKITIVPGANTLDWVLLLPPTATVIIHVTPAENSAVFMTPVSLMLIRAGSTGDVLDPSTYLKRNTATFNAVAVGDYTARLIVVDHVIAERAITLQPGDNALDWSLPPLCNLTVRFPQSDSQLLTPIHPSLTLKFGTNLSMTRTGLRVNGTLEMRYNQIPIGSYQAILTSYNTSTVDERELTTTPGDQTIEWKLPAVPTVTGTLSANGKPVTPNQGVAFYSPTQVTVPLAGVAVTFVDGRYTITDMPPLDEGRIVLLTDAGYGMATVKVKAGEGTVDTPMALKPGGALTITDLPFFSPVTGANRVPGSVVLTSVDAGTPMLILSDSDADTDGKIIIPCLPPGHWHYQASDRYATHIVSGDVNIVAGQTQTISVAQKPPAGG